MTNRNFLIFGALAIGLVVILMFALNSVTELTWLWIWLIAISVITFGLYGYDKAAAKANIARIPESLFHLLALAGGFIGALGGMLVFHHKTNYRLHPFFILIIIVSGVIWGVLIYWLLTGS